MDSENPISKRDKATSKRKAMILESAAICFAENGFHKTSIRDIAEKAGISLGNLYNHFDGKDALIGQISELEADELVKFKEILANTQEPSTTLKLFVSSYFDFTCLPKVSVLAAEIEAEAIRNPQIAGGYIENRNQLSEELSILLEEGRRQKKFSYLNFESEVASLILDIVESAATRVAFSKKAARKQTKDAVISMIEKVVS